LISQEEKRDLVAFLESLTDEEFLTDARFSDPWAKASGASDPATVTDPR